MRVLWTTENDDDPALVRSFPARRSDTVATAVVAGRPVVVTTKYDHDDLNCDPYVHELCPPPGLHVWDRATGEHLRTVPEADGFALVTLEFGGRPYAVVHRPRRPHAVVDLTTGELAAPLPGHASATDGLDVEHTRQLATVETGQGTAVLTGGWSSLIRIAVPATGAHREIDLGAGRDAHPLAGLRVGGRAAVVAWADGVTLWDVTDGTPIRTLPLGHARSYASWPDESGLLAVLRHDGEVSLWDAGTGDRLPCGLRARTTMPHTLTGLVTRDGRRLLALSDAEAVDLWDVDADRPAGPPLAGATDWNLVATAEPGVLVTVSNQDDAVTVWQVGEPRPEPAGASSTVTALAVAPDGRAVIGGSDGVVRWWSLSDGTAGPILGTVTGGVRDVAVQPVDGEIAVLAVGGAWNGHENDRLHRWIGDRPDQPTTVGHSGQIERIAAAGATALTAGGHTYLRAVDVRTGEIRQTIDCAQLCRVVAGIVDGRPVAAYWNHGLRMIDLETLAELPLPEGTGRTARQEEFRALLPGTLITIDDFHLRAHVHNLADGTVWAVEPDEARYITAVAVSPSGRHLAVASRAKTLAVTDLTTRTRVGTHRFRHWPTALTWADDSTLLAAHRRDLTLLRISQDPDPTSLRYA